MNWLNKHIIDIETLCKSHEVKALYAYGSVVDDNKFKDESDVDLIVKFNDKIPVENYADLYFDLTEQLEILLKRKVDLMIKKSIQNRFLKENIEETQVIIYEA